jgi:hypothetical protein
MIAETLWQIFQQNFLEQLSTDGSAGHDFENLVVQRVYTTVSKDGRFKVYPPRNTLKLGTLSRLYHQIDVVVIEGGSTYHLIECKFIKAADIEELYALNAKLLDYAIGSLRSGLSINFRGYYLTGLTNVNDNFYQYSIAWGITPIVLGGLPPLEYMAQKTPKGCSLYRQIIGLLEATKTTDVKRFTTRPQNADQLFTQWRRCHQLWKQEGYDT